MILIRIGDLLFFWWEDENWFIFLIADNEINRRRQST